MRVWSIAVVTFFACTDGDDDNPDTGVTDVGFLADGCHLDNPARDSGINLPSCNPGNGQGCEVSSGRYCVWNYDTDEGSCRCLGDAPKARAEVCNLGLQDCAAGNVCIPLSGDVEPACRPVCSLMSNPVEACEQYNTATETHYCFALQQIDGSFTTNHGLCVDIGPPCDPLDDRCPATENCSLLSATLFTCQAVGTVPIGGDCLNEACARGGLCVELTDGSGNPLGTTCYEPCDLMAPACTAGACTDVGIQGFGLCI